MRCMYQEAEGSRTSRAGRRGSKKDSDGPVNVMRPGEANPDVGLCANCAGEGLGASHRGVSATECLAWVHRIWQG